MKFFEGLRQRIPDSGPAQAGPVYASVAGGIPSGRPYPDARNQRCTAWKLSSQQNQGTLFGFIDLFSGGMFRRLTIFALGIMPYITASIILQLLTVVVPTLEKLQKEGELGRRKITQWTRYLTVGLAMMQSFGIAVALQTSQGGFVHEPGFGFVADDRDHADHRHGVHHVAGRADHASAASATACR